MATVPVCIRTSPALIGRCCPPRRPDSHKGDYGRVLIVAGAEGFTGAPVLAARAALRAGAGLIFTAVPRAVYPIVGREAGRPHGAAPPRPTEPGSSLWRRCRRFSPGWRPPTPVCWAPVWAGRRSWIN